MIINSHINYNFLIITCNSCVSYYGAAQTLTFAGARAYIGTLAPVSTAAAKELAETIFTEQIKEQSLPLAMWLIQQRIFPNPDDRTYVHVGCHFTRILPPRRDVSALVCTRINKARLRWEQKFMEEGAVRKEKIETFARFLSALLAR